MQLKAAIKAVTGACMALGLAAAANAQSFDRIVVFGDSLSDGGAYTAYVKSLNVPGGDQVQYFKFTTNQGNTWVEDIAARLGLPLLPNVGAGGTNYAQGGARIELPTAGSNAATPQLPIAQQINEYLATGQTLGGKTLVILQGGANDIFDAFLHSANPAAQIQIDIPVALLGTNLDGSGGLAAQMVKLEGAGAHNFVVSNIPDIGYTPAFGLGVGAAAAGATAATESYNAGMRQVIQKVGGNVFLFDAFTFFHEVQANAAAYGFTNISSTACLTSSSLLCTPATTVPNGATSYFFADSVHPTTAAHAIWADAVAAQLMAPMQISMLPYAVKSAVDNQEQAYDYRLYPMGRHAVGSADWFGGVNYSPYRVSSTDQRDGIDAKNTGGTIGTDFQVSATQAVGAVLGYNDGKVDFGNSAGSFKTKLTSLALYGRANYGASYAFIAGNYGSFNLDNVHRAIALGPVTRVESGSTSGDTFGLKLGGGWDYGYAGWMVGPVASLDYQKVKVQGYSEMGTDATQLTYSDQTQSSLIGSAGVQARMGDPAMRFVPFARLTYNYNFTHDPSRIAISDQIAVAPYQAEGFTAPRESFTLTAGTTTQLTQRLGLSLQAQGTQYAHDVRAWGLSVGLKGTF